MLIVLQNISSFVGVNGQGFHASRSQIVNAFNFFSVSKSNGIFGFFSLDGSLDAPAFLSVAGTFSSFSASSV